MAITVMSAYIREHDHRERVAEKYELVETLKALIKTHEDSKSPDWVYVCQLIEKLRKAEKQLQHMRP